MIAALVADGRIDDIDLGRLAHAGVALADVVGWVALADVEEELAGRPR